MGLLGGRLLFPQWAGIVRLDPASTARAGQHPVFHEPIPSYSPAGKAGAKRSDTRRYLPPVFLPAQIERGQYLALRQGQGGNVPSSQLTLVLLASDLRHRGHVDPKTGTPLLKADDKCIGVWRSASEAQSACAGMVDPSQTQDVWDPPGMYCTEVRPAGEGLGGGRNLFLMFFSDREHGVVKGQ